MAANLSDCAEVFFENDLRLEAMLSLSLCPDLMALSEATEDFLDNAEHVFRDTGIAMPTSPDTEEPGDEVEGDEFRELVFDHLRNLGKTEWFGKFAHPIESSWGRYRTRWFYSETVAGLIEQALAWAAPAASDAKEKC